MNNINKKHGSSPFGRRHFPRDSGCYEGSPVPTSQTPLSNTITSTDESNSLDDVVAKCSSEILKRVESARRQKIVDEKCPQQLRGLSTTRVSKKGLLMGGCSTLGSTSMSGMAMGEETMTRGGGGLSEKSSDSGVSSSSLSSGPLKNST